MGGGLLQQVGGPWLPGLRMGLLLWQAGPGVSLGLEHRWWFWGAGSLWGWAGGPARCYFQSLSVNNLYIFGSNNSVFTVFGDSAFCIVTAWQRGLWVLFRFIFYIKDLFFIVKDARVGFCNNPCMATDLDHLLLHPWGCPLGVGRHFHIPKVPSCLHPEGLSLSLQGHPSVLSPPCSISQVQMI